MMAAALVAPVDIEAVGNGFQVIDLLVARIVVHPGKAFFVRAHGFIVSYATL